MKKLYWFTAFVLILMVGTYQFVVAGPGQGRRNNQPGNNERPPIPYAEALQLTDEQVNKIGSLIQTSQSNCTILEDKIQESNHQLQSVEWSKDFTPEKVENIMKSIRDSMALLQLQHEKLMVDIKLVLTPEQLQRFNEIQANRNQPPGGNPMPRLFGKIIELNLPEKSFSFLTTDPEGKEMTFKVIFHDGTKFQRENKLVKPEEFKNGEEVTVVGNVMLDKKIIEAMLVVLGKMEPSQKPGPG